MLGIACITAIHVLPSGALFASGPVDVQSGAPSSWSDRADATIETGGTSDGEYRGSLEFLLPLYSKPNELLFAYPIISTADRGQRSYDLGLGFRKIFDKPHVMVGGNFFYDGSESAADHYISQFGTGVEVIGDWMEFRANGYLPEQNGRSFDRTSATSDSLQTSVLNSNLSLGTPFGSGYGIFQNFTQQTTLSTTRSKTTYYYSRYEAGMRGIDLEVGGLIPYVERYGDVRVFGGYYYFSNPYGRDFSGGKARLEAQITDHVILDVSWTQDQQIGSGNFYAGLRFSIPLGAGKDPEPTGRRGLFEGIAAAINHREPRARNTLESQIDQNVIRNQGVHFTQSGSIEDPAKRVTQSTSTLSTLTSSGTVQDTFNQIRSGSTLTTLTAGVIQDVVFVDIASNGGGQNGTFQSPFTNILQAEQLATARFQQTGRLQTIYVVARPGMTYSDAVGFTTAGTQIALLDSSVTLQNTGGGPTFGGTTGLANWHVATGPALTVANVSEFYLGGFNITTGAGPATLINNVPGNTFHFAGGTNFVSGTGPALSISNSHVEGAFADLSSTNSATSGLSLTNVTGNVSVNSLTVTNPAAAGIDIENSSVNFTAGTVSVTGSGGAGINLVSNTGLFQVTGATTIASPTGAGIAIQGSGNTAFGAVNITNRATTGIDINGATGNLGFGSTVIGPPAALANTAAVSVQNSSSATTFSSLSIDNPGSANGVAGISLANTAGSFTASGGTIQNTSGAGLLATSVSGSVTGANMIFTGNGGNGIDIESSTGVFGFTNTAITNTLGEGLNVNGGVAVVNFGGTITSSATGGSVQVQTITGGSVTVSAAISDTGAGINLANNTGGSIAFTGTQTLHTGANNALTLDANNGASISFSNLAITTTTGAGVAATGANSSVTLSGTDNPGTESEAFTFTNTSGTYNYAGLTTSQSGAGLAFDSTETGSYNLGSFTVDGATGAAAFSGAATAANITFVNLAVNNATSVGLKLSNDTGSFTVTGTTTINTTGGDAINLSGAAGSYTFGTVNVTSAGQDGIDLSGITGGQTVTFVTTGITGFGSAYDGINFAGSKINATFGVTTIQNSNAKVNTGTAIDLSSTQAGSMISFLTGSSISKVGIGVELSSGHTTATSADAIFTFGDGSAVVPNGTNSTISAATYTVDAIGLNPASGTYNFADVAFTGSANFPAASGGALFVSATAVNGVGNGSFSNPYSVSDADAVTTANVTFAFLDGAYNFATLNGGAAFTVGANQSVTGLDNGNSVAYGTTQPANVIGNFGTLGGSATRADTGNGTLTISNSAASGDVFDLSGSNTVSDITVAGSGASRVLIASNSSFSGFNNTGGITINGVALSNLQAGGSALSFTNLSGTVSVQGNNINLGSATGALLLVSGGNATYTVAQGTLPGGSTAGTLSGSNINIQNTTGGSVGITGMSLTTSGSTAVLLSGNAATVTLTNATLTHAAGDEVFNIDGTAASTGKITVNGTSTINNAPGTAFSIGAGARDIDASVVNITNDNTTAGGVVAITGQTGGTISFGNITNSGTTAASVIATTGQTGGTVNFGDVTITGYNDATGTAVSLAGASGAVNFTDLDITTTLGAGLNAGGITLAPGSSSISATGGSAVTMNGTTLSGGVATFASVSAATTGGAAGISLTNTVGATTFTTVDISGTGADSGIILSGAGTVSIDGGTIDGTSANGIDSTNTILTASGVTIGGTTAPGGIGIHAVNNDGTARVVTISNDNIKSAGDAISTTDGGHVGELSLVLDGNTLQTTSGSSLAMSIVGSALNSTTVNSFNGVTVTGSATGGGGILFNDVTFSSTTGGAGQVTGGTANIGQSTSAATRVQGNGLDLEDPTGSLSFTAVNIYNNNGTGLLVNTKTPASTTFAFGNSGGVVDTTNGTAMNIDPLTANLAFGSLTSTNAPTSGVILNTIGGSVALGTVSVTNATAAGVSILSSSATVTAGSVTVNGAATGLQLGANTGSFTVSGATNLTNITGTGINANDATGTYQFAGLTIGFSGAGRGIDFRGSDVQFQAATMSITGDGTTAGSIGIDLSGTLNPNGTNSTTPNILLADAAGQTAAISGVGTGVLLGTTADGSAGAYFRFGNQTMSSNSSIAVNSGGLTLDTTHLTSTSGYVQGRYEFDGVTFTGEASFQNSSASFYWVSAAATGIGDGSSPGNLADAASLVTALNGNTLSGKTVVFVNDGAPIAFGTSALNLDSQTNLEGFGNGATIAAFTIPVNVIINTFSGTISDPTGNGAATLSSTSTGTFVNLKDFHTIQNIDISGGATQIGGSGFTNLTLQGTTLSGATGTEFSFTNASGVVNITNNTITQSGGRLLSVNGGAAAITLSAGTGSISNTGGTGVSIVNTTGGSVTLTGLSVTGATATPLTFDNNKATFSMTNDTFAVNAGVTLLNVDTGTGGSTTALTFGATDTLTQSSGAIAIIGSGARNIDLSAQNFTNTGTSAANVIEVTGLTGGTISFGQIDITGYLNPAGTAVNLQGAGGAVTFAALNITATDGSGLNVGGITFTPGSSSITVNSNGRAVIMSGTTLGGGSATFASVTDNDSSGSAISLSDTIGTTIFTTVNISNSGGAAGISLNTAGPTEILGGTIGSTDGGIDSTNTPLTATGVTIGGAAEVSGIGIHVVNNDGTARVVTISNDNITSDGDAISTTDGGHTGELSLVLNGNTVKTLLNGLAMSIVGSSLNSTTVNSFNGVTVNGGSSGGILLQNVTFSSTTGGSGVVNGGTANVGQGGSFSTFVKGNGLDLEDPTGSLSFTTLNIYNFNGTGLLVNTKTPTSTTFTLGNSAGAIDTFNAPAMSVDPLTANLTFSSLTSTNSNTSGVILNTVGGTVALGAVNVTGATAAGLSMVNSSATVTASSVTVNGAATGLQFGANTGSFTVSGATSLTNITGTGVNGQSATGTYQFAGLTIGFTGAGKGIDLRSSDVTQFSTANLSITGDGTTAGSIGIDLSGSQYPSGQPVTANAPNISLATGSGQTAAISGVATGVELGNAALGSAGAYLRYGNQTAGNSGSSIAVNSGGFTVDTTHLTSTTAYEQGRYEFTGVMFTGQASFQTSNTDFIFVGSAVAGSDNGSNPNNRESVAQLQALDATASNLNGKTIVFVNDGSINFGATTLTLGTNTVIEGFGNGATVTVPGGVQPVNVIGDNFPTGGGAYTSAAGAATLTANSGVNVITLANGDTVQNVNFNAGNNQIIGSGIAGFTMNGVAQTAANASAISLTNATGTISMTGGSIGSAAGPSFNVNGGSATIGYSGSITNTAGHSVSVQGITGGSVTLSGTINDTGTGILVQSNTGGTVTFSGASDTINTGGNEAITLLSNAGATINFSGGGLNITTSTATGFGAASSGTISVTGTGNTITSTGVGEALFLQGVAIGTSGFILQNVSSTGSSTISLSTLTGGGTTGIQVTGTGTTVGSGGVIQGATSGVVSLLNLGSLGGGVTLDNMTFSGVNGIIGNAFGTLSVANTSVTATAGYALNLTNGNFASGSAFTSLSSNGASANGVLLNTIGGSVALGSVSVSTNTNGSGAVSITGSSAAITASSVTVNGAVVGLQLGNNTGSFTVSGATSLTNITGTGINAQSATGTYSFQGLTIGFSGAGTGIDLRSSDVTQFSTANLSITGDGTTAGSIGIDLSGSSYPSGQPVTANTPNISLATGSTQTAAISGVATGVELGNASQGSAGAYLRYGNQTSGSSMNVNSGGVTVDTTHLTSTSAFQQGRYEFAGVNFNGGLASFQSSNTSFIFVGSTSAGADSGADPNDRLSLTQFLASDNTTAFLGGKTIVFVNDGSINLGTATLNPGNTTTIESFGNGATVTVPGGTQPVNVIGTFPTGGGSYTGSAATLTANSGVNVITLDNADTVQNININGGNNQIFGSGFSGFTMVGVTQTNAGASAISLANANATISMTGGSISGAAGASFSVSGSSANITYTGTISQTNAANAISISGKTGGTTTFSGTITASTSTANAISLSGNTGAIIVFSNTSGASDITTTSGNGFNITGGGTVNITGNNYVINTTSGTGFNATAGTVTATGTGNTITATTGIALNVVNATIGASNLTFQSISAGTATASDGVGINLNNTGANGGLVVTGTGITAGSGGTIQQKTGTLTNSTTDGIGIELNNTADVSLANMQLSNFSNYGIYGSSVAGFSLANSTINGVIGQSASATYGGGYGEGNVFFSNLTGNASITGSTITGNSGTVGGAAGGAANSFVVVNGSGTTLSNLSIQNTTFANNNMTTGTFAGDRDFVFASAGGSNAIMTLTVSNSAFNAARGELALALAEGTSVMNVTFTGSSFTNYGTGLSGSPGLDITGGGSGTNTSMTLTVGGSTPALGNTFQTAGSNSGGAALNVSMPGGAGTYYGKIENNTIGTSTANSGTGEASAAGIAIDLEGNNGTSSTTGAHTGASEFLIMNNTIQQYGEEGLLLRANSGNLTLDATVFGNVIKNPETQAFAGIFVDSGANVGDTNTINVVIGSATVTVNKNTLTGSDPAAATDVYISNNNGGGVNSTINLSKNGSTGTSANTVIVNDNNDTDDPSIVEQDAGTINLTGSLPPTPP